jgi:hypothetical protein
MVLLLRRGLAGQHARSQGTNCRGTFRMSRNSTDCWFVHFLDRPKRRAASTACGSLVSVHHHVVEELMQPSKPIWDKSIGADKVMDCPYRSASERMQQILPIQLSWQRDPLLTFPRWHSPSRAILPSLFRFIYRPKAVACPSWHAIRSGRCQWSRRLDDPMLFTRSVKSPMLP